MRGTPFQSFWVNGPLLLLSVAGFRQGCRASPTPIRTALASRSRGGPLPRPRLDCRQEQSPTRFYAHSEVPLAPGRPSQFHDPVIESALIYIHALPPAKRFVGCGALVEGGYVATCRHV